MNKDFILKHLKEEHMQGYGSLQEIVEESGLETVKTLLKNHETLTIYVPTLQRNNALMRDVIKENYKTLSCHKLEELTGLPIRRIKEMIAELKH